MDAVSYQMVEMAYAFLAPAHALSNATRLALNHPFNLFGYTAVGRRLAASAEMFERMTRRYAKPDFGIENTLVGGERVPVIERVVWEQPFCRLLHFERQGLRLRRPQPRLLIVAPMSGHYATLLRGTVEAFLPTHEVYITDWTDARMVPAVAGDFDLHHYIDYLI